MTLVIIAGEIDLSVESMAGLASAVLGFLWAAGVPIWIGVLIVLGVGALGGLMNGLMIARGGLPSLVVTLGTLALFRGLALIVLGPQGDQQLPAPSSPTLGFGVRARDPDPVAVRDLPRRLPSSSASSCTGRGWAARSMPSARARAPPGSPACASSALRISLFVLSGLVAALAGVILTSRSVQRPRRRRPGHDPDRGHRRPAGRRQHLRRPGHHPRRRARRARSWP